ncbi:hypothetical protein TNCV_4233891 [Trichonephila clavipes]|nr:hypothetical protein TNCV_4233891 [Trichonephila clavipes]
MPAKGVWLSNEIASPMHLLVVVGLCCGRQYGQPWDKCVTPTLIVAGTKLPNYRVMFELSSDDYSLMLELYANIRVMAQCRTT